MNQYNIMGYNIQILGYKAEISDPKETINLIRNISSDCNNGNCIIQLLNGKGISGQKHILQATSQALKAFHRDENIAKDLGLEICVRASFQRQISRALKILGIEKGKIQICVVAINCDNQVINKIGEVLGKKDDRTIHADVNVLKGIYNITNHEINAAGNVERVMMERAALLNLEI